MSKGAHQLVSNQDTSKVRSVHILNARANVIVNLSKLKPAAFSAAASPIMDIIPTYLVCFEVSILIFRFIPEL